MPAAQAHAILKVMESELASAQELLATKADVLAVSRAIGGDSQGRYFGGKKRAKSRYLEPSGRESGEAFPAGSTAAILGQTAVLAGLGYFVIGRISPVNFPQLSGALRGCGTIRGRRRPWRRIRPSTPCSPQPRHVRSATPPRPSAWWPPSSSALRRQHCRQQPDDAWRPFPQSLRFDRKVAAILPAIPRGGPDRRLSAILRRDSARNLHGEHRQPPPVSRRQGGGSPHRALWRLRRRGSPGLASALSGGPCPNPA